MTRFRPNVFEALCTGKLLDTDGQRARALGISQPHMSRMRRGECGVGRETIRKALILFAPISYDELFEEVVR